VEAHVTVRRLSVVTFGLATAAALLLGAAPAMAVSNVHQSGIVGDWGIQDNAQVGQEGARCFYANDGHGNSVLTRVRVSPAEMSGSHATMTWVGWRFKILRSTDNGVTYKPIYTSGLSKDTASSTVYADGFVYKNWYPTTALAEARIRVQVLMLWYQPASKTIVEGRASGEADNYVAKFVGVTPTTTVPFCWTIEA
jgi:hypothetical protein